MRVSDVRASVHRTNGVPLIVAALQAATHFRKPDYKACLSALGACYATTLLAVPVAACVASGGIYVHNSKPDLSVPSKQRLVSPVLPPGVFPRSYVLLCLPPGCLPSVGDPCPGPRPAQTRRGEHRRTECRPGIKGSQSSRWGPGTPTVETAYSTAHRDILHSIYLG